MWSFMESTKPSVFVNGNPDGVERVKKENGFYAFLMESTSIEYTVERNCDTIQIGGLLDSKGYGIALPPGIYIVNKCDFYPLYIKIILSYKIQTYYIMYTIKVHHIEHQLVVLFCNYKKPDNFTYLSLNGGLNREEEDNVRYEID